MRGMLAACQRQTPAFVSWETASGPWTAQPDMSAGRKAAGANERSATSAWFTPPQYNVTVPN